MEEFKVEVTILCSISHKHIIRLFGYCVLQEERQLLPKFWKKDINQEALLVYEFMENRSLDMHLHGRTSTSPVITSWKMRIEILLGVSRAIVYLQCYAERPVIHGDVKSSNILHDVSWAPRLTDFGSALTWEGPDHLVNRICGTYGYVPPEFAYTVSRNLKMDVYSFGVVMLEILTGNKACPPFSYEENEERAKQYDFAGHTLVDFALPLIEAGELWKVLDRRPTAEPTPRQLEVAELMAQTAVRCVRLQWEARPSISEVVAILETALELARCDG
ncbi:unnamed protein product [Urochloa humidicola]